jgi:hypothetical protein
MGALQRLQVAVRESARDHFLERPGVFVPAVVVMGVIHAQSPSRG